LNVTVDGADFRFLDETTNFVINESGTVIALSRYSAIGYLRFHGAITDDVDSYYVYQHYPKFSIVTKICENIQDQKKSQLRGLTQRGVAQADPRFARAFVDHLRGSGLIVIDNNNLVSASPEGRRQLPLFIDRKTMPECIEVFLAN
jgi:hypothetical protein